MDILCHRMYIPSSFFMRKYQKSSKMGRPRLPKGESKSEIVRVRVTPLELNHIESAASRAGQDISEWVREVMLDAVSAS